MIARVLFPSFEYDCQHLMGFLSRTLSFRQLKRFLELLVAIEIVSLTKERGGNNSSVFSRHSSCHIESIFQDDNRTPSYHLIPLLSDIMPEVWRITWECVLTKII
jgi:hypothetical protein